MSINTKQKIAELLDQLEVNAKEVFVREVINGQWKTLSLYELQTDLAIKHMCILIRARLHQDGVL